MPARGQSYLAAMRQPPTVTRALMALLLLLPWSLFYWAHYHPKDARLRPTGFVQYDQPYYMANARQYLDGATDGLRYALPFSPAAEAEPIHFQPQTLLLAALWRITGADPGSLFVAFGALAALLCVLLALRVLDRAIGTGASPLLAILFIWGGGLLALTGLGYGLLHGLGLREAVLGAFRFDPGGGWWFMNLGRNLLYPLEAYYHALFFGMVLLLHSGRYAAAGAVGGILALSHPFTGAAGVLLLLAWGAVERLLQRNGAIRWWWLIVLAVFLLLLLAWHGLVLPADAEHRSVVEQWRQPWLVEAESAWPAYVLVAVMAAARLRSRERLMVFWSMPMNRFLVVWAGVFLALENHELVMDPIQPAHFTRGYAWTALFLIGAPALLEAWQRLSGAAMRGAVLLALAGLMLLDNAAWFALRMAESRNGTGDGIRIGTAEAQLFRWLDDELPGEELLIAQEPMVAYLALVYTHHRAWYSHFANTPDAERRLSAQQDYFAGHAIVEELLQPHIAILTAGHAPPFPELSEQLYANEWFSAYRVKPGRR